MQSDSNVYFEFSVRLSILLWFLPNDSTLFAFSLRNNPMCPNSLGCRTRKPTHFIHIDAIPLHCNAFALWPAENLLVKPCFIVVLHFHHLCGQYEREMHRQNFRSDENLYTFTIHCLMNHLCSADYTYFYSMQQCTHRHPKPALDFVTSKFFTWNFNLK